MEAPTPIQADSKLVSDIQAKFEANQSKTDSFFSLEEDSALTEPREILKIKIGSKMLDNYTNISKLTGEIDFKESESTIVEERFPEISKIIQNFSKISEQADPTIINERYIPQQLVIQHGQNVGQLMVSNSSKPGNGAQGDSTLGKIVLQKRTNPTNNQEKNDRNTALDLFTANQKKRLGAITIDRIRRTVKPKWHAPWKLKKVIPIFDSRQQQVIMDGCDVSILTPATSGL